MSIMAQLRADEAIETDSTSSMERAGSKDSTKRAERPASMESIPVTEEPPVYVNPDGTPTRDGWREIGKNLRKPMPSKKRPGRGGMQFDYIDARQVQTRLDAVVGPGNWSVSFRIVDLSMHVVESTVTIFDVSKSDVGYSNNPDSDDESEPFKAAYSDAFKRAAVHWGVGRFLYE